MEAPEKLDRAVLAEVVNDMPREALESRRYSVAETLEDIKARIAKIGVATAGHGGRGLHSFTAQHKRFLWDRGSVWGVFRGCLGGVREYLGVCRVCFVAEMARVELKSGRV